MKGKTENSLLNFFDDVDKVEIKEFMQELERDEQLSEDFYSTSSERERYEIAKPYFDKISFKEFKKINSQLKKQKDAQKLDVKYIAGGVGESIITDKNGQVYFGTRQAGDAWDGIEKMGAIGPFV